MKEELKWFQFRAFILLNTIVHKMISIVSFLHCIYLLLSDWNWEWGIDDNSWLQGLLSRSIELEYYSVLSSLIEKWHYPNLSPQVQFLGLHCSAVKEMTGFAKNGAKMWLQQWQTVSSSKYVECHLRDYYPFQYNSNSEMCSPGGYKIGMISHKPFLNTRLRWWMYVLERQWIQAVTKNN